MCLFCWRILHSSQSLYNISPVLLKFQISSRFNLHLFIGASLSKKIIAKLVRRYSNKEGDISINDFISVASKVASCLGSYKLTLDQLNPYLEVKSILLAMKTQWVDFLWGWPSCNVSRKFLTPFDFDSFDKVNRKNDIKNQKIVKTAKYDRKMFSSRIWR